MHSRTGGKLDLAKFIDQAGLSSKGVAIRSFSQSTYSAGEASNVLGVKISQIIKTIVIKLDHTACLTIVPGDRRIHQRSLRKVAQSKLGWKISDSRLATPEETLSATGYKVGAVPPIGHDLNTFIDITVTRELLVYGGGGSANSILEIPVKILIEMTRPCIGEFSRPTTKWQNPYES